MNRIVLFISFIICSILAAAQKSAVVEAKEFTPSGVHVTITKNTVTVAGTVITYTAQSGYLDLKNDTGKLIAKVFFTYYKKDNVVASKRPLTFAFNGGPGSSSVWLHMGGLGPRRVELKDDGTAIAPPYKVINNEYCWLDKTDLVFIDPVATGYSRAASGE